MILGLGQYPNGSGMAAAVYFAKQKNVKVTVYDFYYSKAMDANVTKLKKFENVKFVLGIHKLDEIEKSDLIVKHQRLREDEPEVQEAKKLGKALDSELSIFFKACPCPIVGITGTRGKSTTTTMIYDILSASKEWRKVWLGGNILISPLTFLDKMKAEDIVVLEMSSFQLESTGAAGLSPQIAVYTNIFRDHLNAYPSMVEYAEAKAQIFRHQKPEDVVFFPNTKDFNAYAKEAPGIALRVKNQQLNLSVPGEHNQMNASFAAAVAEELGVKKTVIQGVLKSFKGLPYRQEFAGMKSGVTIINDSTSTMPDATIVALKSLKGPVHVLIGGNDKELEFGELAKVIKKLKPKVYLMPGNAEKKILESFEKAKIGFSAFESWTDAVNAAHSEAKKGETILFSPGCTSFGEFANEFDRGEKFNKLVKKWK